MNTLVTRFAQQLFLIGITLFLFLTACSNLPTTGEAFTPPPISVVPSLTPPIRVTPSITNTPLRLTATLSPTKVTGLPTRTPAAAPTLLAPLSGDEARAFVIHMQETNGGCELPCWWGITPGKTTGQDAKQILSPLRKFGENYMLGTIYMNYLELDAYANLGFDVQVETRTSENRPVDKIYVESFATVIDDSVRYDESWRRYFVNELFTRLGQPSEVWLGFGPYGLKESKPYFYELMVFYEDLGVTVEYAGPAVKGNPNRACPTLGQLELLRLNIQNPSDPKMVRPPGPGEPFTELRPISEVTDLTPEELYNSIKDSKGQTCLASPAKFWP